MDLKSLFSNYFDDDDDLSDFNFDNVSCKYFNVNSFKRSVKTEGQFSVFNLNIRSLPKNNDSLQSFLSNLGHSFDVLVFTETRLNDSNKDLIYMPGYVGHHFIRPNRRGGGVSVFCLEKYKSRKINISVNTESNIEKVFVEISSKKPSKTKPLIVGGIYVPPDNSHTDKTINDFEALLNNNDLNSNRLILAGDFNIDLLKIFENNKCKDFCDTMFSNGLYQVITLPTRPPCDPNSSSSPTLIDHIWTSIHSVYETGVIEVDLSDHLPNFMLFENIFNEYVNHNHKIKFRDFSLINKEKFCKRINDVSWLDILNIDMSIDINTERFINKIKSIYNEVFPVCTKNISSKRLCNPWVTPALLVSIDEGHNMYKYYRNNLVTHEYYKSYRNKLTNLIRIAKSSFYKSKFDNCIGNISSTWKNINNLLGKRKKSNIEKINHNDIEISDSGAISGAFNEYFSSIASKIVNEIPNVDLSFKDFLNNPVTHSFYFKPTDKNEVATIISSFKNKNSDIESIPSKIYKIIVDFVSEPIAFLFNQSITSGEFPQCLKQARVVPIFKKDDPSNLENYRPISTLPFLSKVFEKLMTVRLFDYFDKFNILNSRQYGFQSGIGTIDALIDFSEYVYQKINGCDIVMSIFIDFSRAFDTINHEILLKKLEYYGVRGVAQSWLNSYLAYRTQYVSCNDHKSNVSFIKEGVPQGSVLGPLLFIIYINDLVRVSDVLKFILYADDTTLLLSDKNIDNLYEMANRELDKVCKWTCANKLLINKTKTKLMIISLRRHPTNNLLKLSNEIIEKVEDFKFLGVWFDCHFNFKKHIEFISSRVSRNTGILRHLSFLPDHILMTLYYCLVYPDYTYGRLVWGTACLSSQLGLIRQDKKLIRVLSGSEWLAHTDPLYKSYKIIKFIDIYKYLLAVFMFKVMNDKRNIYEKYRGNLMNFNHSYFTRHKSNFKLPFYRLDFTQRSIFYNGPSLWNSFNNDVKLFRSVNIFKKNFKRILFDNY